MSVTAVPIGDDVAAWHEGWLSLPTSTWAHTGIAVLHDGLVATFDPTSGDLVLAAPAGDVVARHPTPLVNPHSLIPITMDGEELLWVADTGVVRWLIPRGHDGRRFPGRVALVDRTGRIRQELADPTPSSSPWRPSAVAPLAEEGIVWVADGYQSSLLHAFDEDGVLVRSVDGRETGTAFACPHGLVVDARQPERLRLLVADCDNGRVVALVPDGTILDTIGGHVLRSPSALATWDDRLIVADLHSRLAVFDVDDAFLGYVGEDQAAPQREGWPNVYGEGGWPMTPCPVPGRFNSPHSVAASAAGELFVCEWVVGGRHVRLTTRPRLHECWRIPPV